MIHQRPLATAIALALTAIVTGLQFCFPEIVSWFDRRPAAYVEGQWWRWFTALLVHDDGWTQIVCNFAGLALAGSWVERRYGRARWLLFYGLGGLVGQVAGVFWQPFGAGASVAVCGLLGALFAWLLVRGRHLPRRIRVWGALFAIDERCKLPKNKNRLQLASLGSSAGRLVGSARNGN